jgi:predicted enzyme related to lactoylglutathione lyase
MSRVIHFEIAAKEPEKTIEFYTKVFGWKFENWGGPMEYWMITTGPSDKPGIDGGLSRGEPLDAIVNTIDVESIDKTIKEIEANGGRIIQAKGPIPGVGWYAAFIGPDGNAFGIMQNDPNAK